MSTDARDFTPMGPMGSIDPSPLPDRLFVLRRRARGLLAIAIATSLGLLGGLGGCGEDCTLIRTLGAAVNVVDCAGTPVCDASVSAEQGGSIEVFEPSPGPECAYRGLWERAGTFRVTAARADVRSTPVDVTIEGTGECSHVVTETLTIRLCDE